MRKLFMAVWFIAAVAWAESGQDLFQKALVAERANGKLDEAIKLYQKIAQKFSSDRSLTAKALLQMGQCYEKLGDAQARKSYDRVVRDYTDQGEIVAVARISLGRLGSGTETSKPAGVAVRRVQFADGLTEIGGISPDGRYLSFVDGGHGHGDLSVMDLATGQKRQVTKGASHKENVKVGAELSVFSPDGKQLAYGWHGPPDNDQLRIINVDGTGERTLFKKEDRPMWIQTQGWAGGHVLIKYGLRDSKESQILVVSVADGSVRILKTLQGNQPLVRLSPDGRWVAVSHRASGLENNLSLISTIDGREVPLPKQAGDAEEIQGWTPDGKALLFTSTRDGRNNLYGLHIENGKAVGSPVLIRRDVADLWAIGVTSQGSLYYNTWYYNRGFRNIFSATLDPDTGRIQSAPVLATSLSIGENSYFSWSPDGSKIAYRTARMVEPSSSQCDCSIAIQDVASGSVREIRPRLSGFGKLQWRPDGKALLTAGASLGGKQGIFSIDAQTGEATALALHESDTVRLTNPIWGPDGKSILYSSWTNFAVPGAIMLRNLDNGRTGELGARSDRGSLALSPDGSQVAFFSGNALMALPISGGKARTILQLKQPEYFVGINALAWTPDGRRLLFFKEPTNSSEQSVSTLWRVSADGGEPENTGLAMKGMHELSVHPDGRRIGFTARSGSGGPETWVLERFAGLL